MYFRLKAFWKAALDLLSAVDAGVVDLEMRNVFDLAGVLWNSRTLGDDRDICLRPAETANGLRRTNAISVAVRSRRCDSSTS